MQELPILRLVLGNLTVCLLHREEQRVKPSVHIPDQFSISRIDRSTRRVCDRPGMHRTQHAERRADPARSAARCPEEAGFGASSLLRPVQFVYQFCVVGTDFNNQGLQLRLRQSLHYIGFKGDAARWVLQQHSCLLLSKARPAVLIPFLQTPIEPQDVPWFSRYSTFVERLERLAMRSFGRTFDRRPQTHVATEVTRPLLIIRSRIFGSRCPHVSSTPTLRRPDATVITERRSFMSIAGISANGSERVARYTRVAFSTSKPRF